MYYDYAESQSGYFLIIFMYVYLFLWLEGIL